MGPNVSCCTKDPMASLNRKPVSNQIVKKFQQPILFPAKKSLVVDPHCPKLYGEFHYPSNPQRYSFIKVPENPLERTRFVWRDELIWEYPIERVRELKIDQIKGRTFQEKLVWIKQYIERERGKENSNSGKKSQNNKITVDPTNVLLSSYESFDQVDFNLELKVIFEDDKAAIDAGGLFREWMNLCIIEAFSPELGMLKLCETDETAYKLQCNRNNVKIFAKYAKVLGFVIGKSILERIPINCYLNRTLLRMLTGNPIELNDVYNFDKQLYHSWKSILDEKISEEDLFTFTDTIFDPFEEKNKVVELKKGGKDIFVNEGNKQEYIKSLIKYHCYQSVELIVNELKNSLYQVIPYRFLQIFEPHELEMLICGRQEIDLEDWKKHTNYKGYSSKDQVVGWFWQILEGFTQEQLSNLLHFTTGSAKVPISGFRNLECKRGKVKQFYIKKVELNPHNPYPKGITCFNRLEIPQYSSYEEMYSMLYTVAQDQIHDFGLDNVQH